MNKIIGLIVLLGGLYLGYQAHWFDEIINYVVDSYEKEKEEKVIYEPDGSITTIRHKNIIEILSGTNK